VLAGGFFRAGARATRMEDSLRIVFVDGIGMHHASADTAARGGGTGRLHGYQWWGVSPFAGWCVPEAVRTEPMKHRLINPSEPNQWIIAWHCSPLSAPRSNRPNTCADGCRPDHSYHDCFARPLWCLRPDGARAPGLCDGV